MIFRFKMRLNCAIFLIFIAFCKGDQGQAEAYSEDAKEILLGPVYHWKDWCFCQHIDDYLYIWSEAAVLIFWKNSSFGNVWYIIDSRYMRIDSNGCLENSFGTESELQEVRRMIKSTNHTQPILSHVGSTKLVFGNWYLSSRKEGEMTIQHTYKEQAITLQEGFFGFASSSEGKNQTFSAKTSMGAEFSASWIPGRESNQLRTNANALKLETEHQSNLTSCCTLNRKNYDSGSTEIKCDTNARLHNITYVWNINRFDLHKPDDSEVEPIKSPSFSSATYDKIKWYLKIYPGNKTSDKISLFLHRCPNSKATGARIKYSVRFLDSKGNVMYTLALNWFKTFMSKKGWGSHDIPINEIISPDNTLRIVCKIAVCEFTTNVFHLNCTDTT